MPPTLVGVEGRAVRTDSAPTFRILDRDVTLPVEVRHARAAMATFLVRARVAQSLLPGDELEVATTFPGRTPLLVGVIDYEDNDLGDYLEVSILVFVRPRAQPRGIPVLSDAYRMLRGRLGTYILALPVDQEFTCEAGRRIWGFPKTVERISLDRRDGEVVGRLEMDGRHVLTLSVRTGGARTLRSQTITTYTHLDGVLHRTEATQAGTGVGIRAGGARIELGDHPLADSLRSAGLPKRPLMSMWFEHFSGTFGPAVPVD